MKKALTILFVVIFCFLLTVPCFADEGDLVRSSIVVKPAPEVVSIRTEVNPETGKEAEVIADVVKKEDQTQTETRVKTVYSEDLLVTAYSDRNAPQVYRLTVPEETKEEAKIEIKYNLDTAYDDITNVKDTLGELHETVEKYLDQASKDLNKEYDSSVYGAVYLFDIWTTEGIKNALNTTDATVTLRFELDTTDNDTLEVLHRSSESEVWEAIPADRVHISEDHKFVDVTFDNFCPVLFLKASEKRAEVIVSRCCRKCPSWCPFCPWLCGRTIPFIGGTHCLCWVPIVILILLIILIIIIIRKLTKDDEDEEEKKKEDEFAENDPLNTKGDSDPASEEKKE